MEIILPIYINTSKNKKVLMSLNWYRNSHYGIKDKVKKQYHEIVYEQLRGARKPFDKRIGVKYQLWYKRGDCDLMNVVSVLDKFLLCLLYTSPSPRD